MVLEKQWVPTPRYLCRRWLVLKLLSRMPKGRFLEIGIGAGDFISVLAAKGYRGVGVDISQEALRMTRQKLKGFPQVIAKEMDFRDLEGKHDIVFAFEVLEHIEDDVEALERINQLLNTNKFLIVSVPAHKSKWALHDERGGHLRRYEKQELISKLVRCGFRIEVVWSYGFPLVNLVRIIRNYLYAKSNRKEPLPESLDERVQRSGLDREVETKFKSLFNDKLLYPFYRLQELFLGLDLGTGYLVKARKVAELRLKKKELYA